MGTTKLSRKKSIYLNRRQLIKAGVTAASFAMLDSLLGCAHKGSGAASDPALFGSRNSVNPGESISLWTPQDHLTETIPMTSEADIAVALRYSNKSGLFEVPQTASGVYMIENERPIIVKDPTKQAPIVVVFPYNTVAAYTYTDKSMYNGPDMSFATRAREVSFMRPTDAKFSYAHGFLDWHAKLPPDQQKLFRFIADQDMDDYDEISDAKVLVIIGHSEYWTRDARVNFDLFVGSGGHAAVLSGNTMYWQVRYTHDGASLVCYKSETEDQPDDPLTTTTLWDSDILGYPTMQSIGANFSNGGFGVYPGDAGWDGYRIINASSPLLAGTGLKAGQVLKLPTHEYDGAPILGFKPSGVPILDEETLGFYRTELIGWDLAQLSGTKTVPTFFAFQKSASSGIVVNTASTSWCAREQGLGSVGVNGNRIRQITSNIIFNLLNGKPIFS